MRDKCLTMPSKATAHAPAVCMNGRASHFIMQAAIACTAPVGGVIALGKARRILQGESPCRVRFNQPPVSSVDLIEESGN